VLLYVAFCKNLLSCAFFSLLCLGLGKVHLGSDTLGLNGLSELVSVGFERGVHLAARLRALAHLL